MQFEVEDWSYRKNFEVKVWSWSFLVEVWSWILKLEVEVWSWSFKFEVWSWSMNLKFEVEDEVLSSFFSEFSTLVKLSTFFVISTSASYLKIKVQLQSLT